MPLTQARHLRKHVTHATYANTLLTLAQIAHHFSKSEKKNKLVYYWFYNDGIGTVFDSGKNWRKILSETFKTNCKVLFYYTTKTTFISKCQGFGGKKPWRNILLD